MYHTRHEFFGKKAVLQVNDGDRLFSVKMRASRDGKHISGAERIVAGEAVPDVAAALAARALGHSKGRPDFVNVKIESAAAPIHLAALPVSTRAASTPEEGWSIVRDLLAEDGIARIDEIVPLFAKTSGMRGAMLLHADTLERLEPDPARGIRATFMDAACKTGNPPSAAKNHFAEAIVLATKVANAPGIVGEICMSDDPDYATGYVATRRLGYVRITCLKRDGDPSGGRIFLYRGKREDVARTIDFIEHQCVLVDNPPPTPNPQLPARDSEPGTRNPELPLPPPSLRRHQRICPAGMKVFSENDYLGLANDSRLKAAAKDAIERFGAGSGSARLVSGTKPPHVALERHLARFKGTEDAVTWPTGYMANVGTISAIVGRGDVVFSDELNHASIIDGCRLSRADVVIYRHNDMGDLAEKIARCGARRRMLAVSDAVFSMDGDVLDLPRFLETCRAAGVMTMVDEAHSTGVLGETGRGICEHFGAPHPDILMGTLSKALGSEGGYVCAARDVCEYLRNASRSFIFTTAGNPGSAAAADKALAILEEHPELACEVRRKSAMFARALSQHPTPNSKIGTRNSEPGTRNSQHPTPIIPIIVGDETRAVEIAKRLEDAGFLVPAIRYPTVPKGMARLRVSVSAATPEDDLMALAAAIRKELET